MSRLHIFNPSHDEALAANSPYYYPARAARILGYDLAVLPAWWAAEGDYVLLPEQHPLPEVDFTGRGICFVRPADLKKEFSESISEICPWGWDALLVRQLRQQQIGNHLLPDDHQLQVIRQLSSRQTAVELLRRLREDLPDTLGTSAWCTSEEEVWATVATYGRAMLKAPWSSSGRGVFATGTCPNEGTVRRVVKILKEQGGIEVEPFYERVMDFAAEFYATAHGVEYVGLSVFATTDTGAYAGNLIGDDEFLLSRLPEVVRPQLPAVLQSLCQHLKALLSSHYTGPLGVDLMVAASPDGQLVLHPCIEINLRRTMGHVALALRQQLPEAQTGIYRLRPVAIGGPADLHLTPFAQEMEAMLRINGADPAVHD